MPRLKALSVRQPWAWAIIHAGKDIENRSWQAVNHGLRVRGRICIHAAKGMTRDEYDEAREFIDGTMERKEVSMMETTMVLGGWLKKQINEAHERLDDLQVPSQTVRPDFNRGKMAMEDKVFTLGVPERIIVLGRRVAELEAVRAERDKAQKDCERMGREIARLRKALLRITAIIETQTEPDINALHDEARDALAMAELSLMPRMIFPNADGNKI